MEVEFDPAKDEANLAKHGVSLQAAADFDFTTSLDCEDTRFDYGEVRFVSIGFIGDRLYFLAYADGSTDDAIRAISLRRAEKHEMRFYYASQV